jgi:hypothetical protein
MGEAAMSEVESAAQAHLRGVVEELDRIRVVLEGIASSLPVSPREETYLEEGGEWDVATEVRSVIECVLTDQILPAIRDLQAAAVCRPKKKD